MANRETLTAQESRLVEFNGRRIDIDAARALMDDDICEQLHGITESEQEFLDAYLAAHEAKYGKPFVFG